LISRLALIGQQVDAAGAAAATVATPLPPSFPRMAALFTDVWA
jgi:hypothetical protein